MSISSTPVVSFAALGADPAILVADEVLHAVNAYAAVTEYGGCSIAAENLDEFCDRVQSFQAVRCFPGMRDRGGCYILAGALLMAVWEASPDGNPPAPRIAVGDGAPVSVGQLVEDYALNRGLFDEVWLDWYGHCCEVCDEAVHPDDICYCDAEDRAICPDCDAAAQCDGAGEPADGVQWQNAVCPVCHAIANVDDGRIEPHAVRVIG